MFRTLIISTVAVAVSFMTACGEAAPANSSVNANANTRATVNSEIKLDPANRPPGLSGKSVPISPNTPGIPVNAGPKGTTPIPGIPSEAELKKKKKPGTTPIPGIPDEATIRKAMGQPPRNANIRP